MNAPICLFRGVPVEDESERLFRIRLAADVVECLNVRNIIINKPARIVVQIEQALEADDSDEKVDSLIRILFLKEEGRKKKLVDEAMNICKERGKMAEDVARIFITDAVLLELAGNSSTKSLRKGIKKRLGLK
jgi:hypothetical protein